MPRHDEVGSGSGGGPVRGGARWARRWWRALVGELVATALLVWLGLAPAVPLAGRPEPPLAHVAMAFGFVVMANVMAFGPASGAHMNPAVTLAALAAGTVRAGLAAAYVCAQLAGAVLGFLLLQATPGARRPVGHTAPAPGLPPAAACGLEAALTGLLAAACLALWAAHDPARPDPAAPIKLGLLVAGLVYAGGAATGASLNPARSFAPALLYGEWEHHWVYWVGPLCGAALAAILHRWVLAPPAPRPAAPAPEDLPLADKP